METARSFLTLILFILFLYSVSTAQNSVFREDNKLSYKNSESYKSISFMVEFTDSEKSEENLISLLKRNGEIFEVSVEKSNGTCTVNTKLSATIKTIIDITGPAGYKTSDFSEKVNLLMQVPAVTAEEREKIEYDREQENNLSTNWPSDFPKYINTGNKQKDDQDYAARKKEWIKNNPEKYKKISGSTRKFETKEEKSERIEKENNLKK